MSFLNGKEWGSKGNQVLDFFPRIVDVGAEMTFANTQENRKKLPPFLGQIRHLQLKIFPIFCFRIYVKVLGKLPQSSQKKVNTTFLGLQEAKFCSSPSTSISCFPKISSAAETNKVWWDYKEWNHLIPNSVWYGFYLLGSNVLGMFSTAT